MTYELERSERVTPTGEGGGARMSHFWLGVVVGQMLEITLKALAEGNLSKAAVAVVIVVVEVVAYCFCFALKRKTQGPGEAATGDQA